MDYLRKNSGELVWCSVPANPLMEKFARAPFPAASSDSMTPTAANSSLQCSRDDNRAPRIAGGMPAAAKVALKPTPAPPEQIDRRCSKQRDRRAQFLRRARFVSVAAPTSGNLLAENLTNRRSVLLAPEDDQDYRSQHHLYPDRGFRDVLEVDEVAVIEQIRLRPVQILQVVALGATKIETDTEDFLVGVKYLRSVGRIIGPIC